MNFLWMLWFDEKSISNVPPVMWLCLHISIFFSGYVHMQNKNDESKRALKCHFESLKWSREDRSFKKLDWNLDFFECRYFLNLNPYLDTVVKILAQILPARKSPNVWKKFLAFRHKQCYLPKLHTPPEHY